MSRSSKRTPIFGYASGSDKISKRKANRTHRHLTRMEVSKESATISLLREVSDVWGFQKDGKQYYARATWRDMRK